MKHTLAVQSILYTSPFQEKITWNRAFHVNRPTDRFRSYSTTEKRSTVCPKSWGTEITNFWPAGRSSKIVQNSHIFLNTYPYIYSSGIRHIEIWQVFVIFMQISLSLETIAHKPVLVRKWHYKTGIGYPKVIGCDYVTWSRKWRWRHSDVTKIDKIWQNMTIFAVYWLYLLN